MRTVPGTHVVEVKVTLLVLTTVQYIFLSKTVTSPELIQGYILKHSLAKHNRYEVTSN